MKQTTYGNRNGEKIEYDATWSSKQILIQTVLFLAEKLKYLFPLCVYTEMPILYKG